jgi:hypothetical protein
MACVSQSRARVAAWDEVAELYGGGVSPFGLFSEELVRVALCCRVTASSTSEPATGAVRRNRVLSRRPQDHGHFWWL